MKKKDIPQDKSGLANFTKELYYTESESGEYTTGLSSGWEVKSEALNVAWDDIREKVNEARQKVEAGEASPILYFMELRLMDTGLLSSYTGFWKWQIKRHLKPKHFKKLSAKKLKKYSEAFDISVPDLLNMKARED